MEKERAEESSLEIRNKVKNDCQCHTSSLINILSDLCLCFYLNLNLNDHVSPFAHCPGLSSYLHQGQGEGQVSGEGCRLPLGTRYIIRRKPLTRYKIREKPSTRYMKVHNACKGYRQCIYLCKTIDTNTTVTKTTLHSPHHWGDHHDQNQQEMEKVSRG